ncbi:MAG: hypothetical protein NC254_09475 [bacterium]|nr:hypothetical protein [bacterium]
MKNKILLEVYLPSAEQSYEIRVPEQLKVAQVTDMLVEFLRKKGNGYIPTEESALWDMESGRGFDANAFIANIGLHNGSRVMLI